MGHLPRKDIGNLIPKGVLRGKTGASNVNSGFYNSGRWRNFSVNYRKRHPFCVKCDKFASDVDHIEPIVDGGDLYAENNLQSLCKSCHGKKTKKEQKNKK